MLHGKTLFELQDVRTGKVERYEEHNMFTNALDEIFNRVPFGFGNEYIANNDGANSMLMTPVFQRALGGLFLFPEQIEENANNIFAPAMRPTGIASVLDNPNTDTRRGTFIANESGVLSNGYRFVYDFGTSQGNGKISCACLTSQWGGATYLDDMRNLACNAGGERGSAPIGDSRLIETDATPNPRRVFCADNSGLFLYMPNSKTVYKFVKPHSLDLISDYRTSTFLGTIEDAGYMYYTSTHICVARTNGNASGNATVVVDKYSKNDFSKTTEQFVVSAPLKGTRAGHLIAFDEETNNLYMLGYDGVSYYKINLSNLADVVKIDVPSTDSELYNCAPYFIGSNFVIERDDYVTETVNPVQEVFASRVGTYAIGFPYQWNGSSDIGSWLPRRWTGIVPFSTYLATINNLENAVNKSADKTMKVTYTVTNG